MTRRNLLKAAACTSVLAGPATALSASAPPKPNILYLMTDQHRADCLGCAGNKAIKTPNFDSLAADGVRFPNAYSSTPSCTPARSAILTGLSPWHHGMIGYGRIAGQYRFELPQAIRDAGYYLFGIGKMHWHPQKKLRGYHGLLLDESGRAETPGFVSDYRLWFKEQAPDLNPDATGIGWNDYRAKAYALPERLHPTAWTADRAVEFIEKYDRAEPFLLKVSFARPHSPYDPPQRLLDMYNVDDMPAPVVGAWAQRNAPLTMPTPAAGDRAKKKKAQPSDQPNPSLWHGDLGVRQAQESRRAYYASVTFIDEQVGRILAALKKRGLYDNTLILFFADHGDMLGDHHLWRKTYAYESSANIPMILRWPTGMGMNDRRGRTLPQTTELRDVLPTFLDAARAPIPGHLDGRSLLELVRGNTKSWRPWIDLEHSMCYDQDHWTALTDGRFKYIYYAYDGREQLFDMAQDPGETRNLAEEPASEPVLKQWRERMVQHLSERGEEFVSGGKLTIRKQRFLYSPHFPKDA
jgi:arylsulfatase A-like enzyme